MSRLPHKTAAIISPARFIPRASAAWCGLLSVMIAFTVGCHSRDVASNGPRSGQRLDFNQDVQPILASNCFSCHGPDPEMRKAGLRLDLGESAFKKRPGHPDAIVPWHPEQSELIKRI